MSFYDDASLVFLPSGGAGKDTKAYSIKPTNGDGDFTFSRGSNLTATRVDSNGLIEKGRENLLLQSNSFDTTWSTSGSPSLSSGQSGYDGSSDAWLYTNNGSEYIYQDETTNVATYSVFAKKGNGGVGDFLLLFTDGVGGRYFDLDNGDLGSELLTGLIDSKIELVSGTTDWYRCSVTFASSTRVRIYASLADGDLSSVASIYIQDAQLEQGLVATEYIESGASTGLAGILEDSPRFDYSGGASCPSLLLEPSRTNLIPSEYLPLMSIVGSPVITPNVTTSPEGYQNMAEFSSSAESDRYQKNLGVLSGQHTFSAFFKYSGTDKSVYLRMSDTSSRLKVDIASSGVTIDSGGSSNIDDSDVIDYGNGIYRAYMIFTPSTGTTFAQFYPSATDTSGSIYAYGFQMEEGSYPTSYIPNHSSGSVTREVENIVINSLDQTYSTDITIFLEVERLVGNSEINKFITDITNSSSSNNRIAIYSTSDGRIRVLLKDDTGTQENLFSSNNSFIQGTPIKIAIKITQSVCTLFIDGSSVATSSSVGSILGIDKINYIKDSIIKQFLLFPSALSDAHCITLTS